MKSTIATINLKAIQKNWLRLTNMSKATCAAMVKADAYGLGSKEVSKALYTSGCRTFFVAYLEEALHIKPYTPQADIYILNGISAGEEQTCVKNNLIPVVNTINALKTLIDAKVDMSIALHIDTGINRLGLPLHEVKQAADAIKLNNNLHLKLLMSHLACADDIKNPFNKTQLKAFESMKKVFPQVTCSLANSSGIYLGDEYHFDVIRPGYALYGGNPTPYKKANPMDNVLTIKSGIMQLKKIKAGESIGYNSTWNAQRDSQIATIPYGYADGFSRLHSNKTNFYIGHYKAPVIGRVSMDMTTLDVTGIPDDILKNTPVTIVGDKNTIDDLSKNINTVGYEVLTNIGNRLKKQYL
ncbi:MAG: alanine racemase [bacterium]|jgi:alanine racemase